MPHAIRYDWQAPASMLLRCEGIYFHLPRSLRRASTNWPSFTATIFIIVTTLIIIHYPEQAWLSIITIVLSRKRSIDAVPLICDTIWQDALRRPGARASCPLVHSGCQV